MKRKKKQLPPLRFEVIEGVFNLHAGQIRIAEMARLIRSGEICPNLPPEVADVIAKATDAEILARIARALSDPQAFDPKDKLTDYGQKKLAESAPEACVAVYQGGWATPDIVAESSRRKAKSTW